MKREIIPFTTEAEWLANRKRDLTSTESPALFGLSPYATQFELYHRKHSGKAPEFKANDRMKWGNRLEAAIAEGIAEEHGWTVEPMKQYMRLPDLRIGSSFDYVITNHASGKPVHLEIKNVDYFAFKDGWIVNDDRSVEAPMHIEMQVQHQMLVSGYEHSIIGALVGGNRAQLIQRPRDEIIIKQILARTAKFWADVDAGNEPPPIMPDDAAAVIAMNQAVSKGRFLDASSDAELPSLIEQYKSAAAAEANAKEDKESLKAIILQRIGDAEKCFVPGFNVSASTTAPTQGTLITEDLVGTYYGARKGFRNFRVTTAKTTTEGNV